MSKTYSISIEVYWRNSSPTDALISAHRLSKQLDVAVEIVMYGMRYIIYPSDSKDVILNIVNEIYKPYKASKDDKKLIDNYFKEGEKK